MGESKRTVFITDTYGSGGVEITTEDLLVGGVRDELRHRMLVRWFRGGDAHYITYSQAYDLYRRLKDALDADKATPRQGMCETCADADGDNACRSDHPDAPSTNGVHKSCWRPEPDTKPDVNGARPDLDGKWTKHGNALDGHHVTDAKNNHVAKTAYEDNAERIVSDHNARLDAKPAPIHPDDRSCQNCLSGPRECARIRIGGDGTCDAWLPKPVPAEAKAEHACNTCVHRCIDLRDQPCSVCSRRFTDLWESTQ
jgi:hypothetical protein